MGAKKHGQESKSKGKRNQVAAPKERKLFPIAGIGISTGGLDAFTELLQAMPEGLGMAFILVLQFDSKRASILAELLPKTIKMPVQEAEDGLVVEPDHVYVIPPQTNLAILDGALHLMPLEETQGQPLPIDHFFRTLADDQGRRAIGVVLSGTTSDGAQGLRAIKASGGVTFAQGSSTAKCDGMSRAAIAAGGVDFILPINKIAKELVRITTHPYVTLPQAVEAVAEAEEDFLKKIFILLRSETGVDFANYKQPTMRRRITRRLVLLKMRSLEEYFAYLQSNADERTALREDILIKVTRFFREPETYAALKTEIFPKIVQGKGQDTPIRIWVPGCSTGEEAYSIAMALVEYFETQTAMPPIKIFATDVDENAIEKARHGIYPENIAADVSPRLQRFFSRGEDNGYRISKAIRDMCIFARHDVTRDPPFSKIDLLALSDVLDRQQD